MRDQEQGFISDLTRRMRAEKILVKDISYIDKCRCGVAGEKRNIKNSIYISYPIKSHMMTKPIQS